MLIKSKYSRIINLGNVSNIGVDYKTNKIIFNLCYNINIFNKIMPDYSYFKFKNREEVENSYKNILNLDYIKENFLISIDPKQRLVSKKCISSIVFDDKKRKIIFNLNYGIIHPLNSEKIISDFVFWTFKDNETFLNERIRILKLVTNI